jgi:hypothetical protein
MPEIRKQLHTGRETTDLEVHIHMPTFNYRSDRHSSKKKFTESLAKAKKKHPVAGTDHRKFPMKHMTVRTKRKDIEG